MRCCAHCFGDRTLQRIIADLASEEGTCSFCETTNVKLVHPKVLANSFAPLLSVYEQVSEGPLLVERLATDWLLFDHPRLDLQRKKGLLAEILDDGEVVRHPFAVAQSYVRDGLDSRWERLRVELMFSNRYFPQAGIDERRLEALLSLLEAIDVPITWYRARIQQGEQMYEPADMGAPPPGQPSHGRANPAGIPYLYLGSTEQTAVAEIRPHTGEVATVAEFAIEEGLRLLDLRNPRKLISPFDLGDEDSIAGLYADIPFIERLGIELTRPVLPSRAAIDYVPSQYLCEFIKKIGYDGVIYRSSVSDGMNVALFSPSRAAAISVRPRTVARVSVEVK